jgi:histidine decarboxylase
MHADPSYLARLTDFTTSLDAARPFNIGFPGATDIDFSPLTPLLSGQLLNNVGDPNDGGLGANHSKTMEREVLSTIAGLLRAPEDRWWGYVTSGSTEGTLHALHTAATRYPDAILYASQASHYSVSKTGRLLGLPLITVRADARGEIDYTDLSAQIICHRDRAAVIVANIGTTMTEAVDDVRRIVAILDAQAVTRRFIHADAALSGIPLALLPAAKRPGMDFADGADSIVVSGHKFFGTLMPCGVVLITDHQSGCERVAYTGTADTTISGSRNGHTPIMLWYVLQTHGIDGLRERAERSRQLANYTVRRLSRIGWQAWRHPWAFTVMLPTPPKAVTDRWVIPPGADGWSHAITMPGITRERIDALIGDLETSMRTIPTQRRKLAGLLATSASEGRS